MDNETNELTEWLDLMKIVKQIVTNLSTSLLTVFPFFQYFDLLPDKNII